MPSFGIALLLRVARFVLIQLVFDPLGDAHCDSGVESALPSLQKRNHSLRCVGRTAIAYAFHRLDNDEPRDSALTVSLHQPSTDVLRQLRRRFTSRRLFLQTLRPPFQILAKVSESEP